MDAAQIRQLHPLNTLSQKGLHALVKGMHVRRIKAGDYIFQAGQDVFETLYVLDGEVELLDAAGKVQDSISNTVTRPFPREVPCPQGAKAASDVRLLEVDSRLLSSVLAWDQPSAAPEAEELDDGSDTEWMSHFLATRGFTRVPPAKLQSVFLKMASVDTAANEVIIKQGTEGDCFYIIAKGRVVVEREASNLTQPVKLAEFGPGACFGEDALISGSTRNATVRMLTRGRLMRLEKNDFNTLLKAPLTPELTYSKAEEMIGKGASWLDVRMPNEIAGNRVANSVNIPFPILRARLGTLTPDKPYVVVCNDGKNSATATFLLSKAGLETYVLRGGLNSVKVG